MGVVDAEPPVGRDAVLGPDLGDHPGRIGIGRVECEAEAEAARETVTVQSLPALAAVVGAVDAAVVLLPQAPRPFRMRAQLVHALAELGIRVVGQEVRECALVARHPRLAAVIGAEDAGRRDADPELFGRLLVEGDRVADQAARARVPAIPSRVLEQRPVRLPGRAPVAGAEEHPWLAAEPKPARLGCEPGLDVPGRGELQPASLRQSERLRAFPGLTSVRGAVHGAAVDPVVRAGVENAVAWVDDCVIHRPTWE